ncbi:MAG: hypothetical protein V7642_801 [Burkholderiales bacterium]
MYGQALRVKQGRELCVALIHPGLRADRTSGKIALEERLLDQIKQHLFLYPLRRVDQ